MTEHERMSWEAALERVRKRLEENNDPKLAPRLSQEVAVIENLLREYGGEPQKAKGEWLKIH
jgi:hypothetical protein